MQEHTIAVIGAGYVGITVGAGLASLGHSVVIVDRMLDRVEAINTGRSPLFEDGLDEAIGSGHRAGLLSGTTDLNGAVRSSEIIFLAVGTPMSDGGHADLTDLETAFDDVVAATHGDTVIVLKSTVPVGTHRALLERAPDGVRLVTNPEFLRQGSALHDFLHPERIVIGADDPRDAALVAELYAPMADAGAAVLQVTPESAALIKYASNAFLATKLSFVNEIADLAELSGADIDEVVIGIGLDARIGTKYLNPGPGFGGSCLPKDTEALLVASEQFGASSHVVSAATRVNRNRIGLMVDKIERAVGGLDGTPLAILGITYKAGTDDLRDSPAIPIVAELHERGAVLTVYDPQGTQRAVERFPWLKAAESLEEALAGTETAVILTEWSEFGDLDPKTLDLENLIDLRNMYSPVEFDGTGTTYVSVGRRNSVSQ